MLSALSVGSLVSYTMKVIACAVFNGAQTKFEISVGAGDKTFKWLGITASQRFASQDPNGALRRRDPPRRGMSNFSSYQGVEVQLSDGQKPHPSAMLMDFLRDGDEVKILLNDNQDLNSRTGLAAQNEWSTLAYTVNGNGIGEMKKEEIDEEPMEKEVVEGENHYTKEQKEGRAMFMRMILKPQMPDVEAIKERVSNEWKVIGKHFMKMEEEDEQALFQVFVDYYDMILEVHAWFSTTHNGDVVLLGEDWRAVLDETAIFSADDLNYYGPRIHRTAHAATTKDKDSLPALNVAGYMYAMVLCAQTVFNDRYDKELNKLTPAQGLRKLFKSNYATLVQRYEMKCMLKESFTSVENLNALKEWRDSIFECFTKYSGRSKELPSSIGFKDFTEMLYDAGLTEPAETDMKGNPVSWEYDTVIALLASVRSGTINGRPMPNADPTIKSDLPDDVIPDDEFTFPEMVEAICRHSFNRFRGAKPDEDGNVEYMDYGGELSVEDCFFKGMVGVIATLQKK